MDAKAAGRFFKSAIAAGLILCAVSLRADTQNDVSAIQSAYANADYSGCVALCTSFYNNGSSSSNMRTVLMYAAMSEMKLNEFSSAEKILTRLDSTYPHAPQNDAVKFLLARALTETGRSDDAAEVYKKLIALYPDSKYAASARDLLQARSRPSPDERVKSLYMKSDFNGILETTSGRLPDSAEPLLATACAAWHMKQPDRALEALDLLIRKFPDDIRSADALFLRSAIRISLGSLKDARADLLELKTRFPDYFRQTKALKLMRMTEE